MFYIPYYTVCIKTRLNPTPIHSYFFLQVYLPWERIIPGSSVQGATVIGLLVFFSYAIVANTVVPISLYVSVEVCAIT